MKALKKLLRNRKTVVFLDLEGTQFSHEIIALGAIKCTLDSQGFIIQEAEKGFKEYMIPTNPIGNLISEMTNITEDFLRDNGKKVDEVLDDFYNYVGEDFENVAFIVFGGNDARMILETVKCSHPKNMYLFKQMLGNIIDYLSFLSQYVKDNHFNTYSLINYLKLFGGSVQGISHDPLNDAIDLKNLYSLVLKNPDILKEEYKKVLLLQKVFPEPVKKVLIALINNQNVSSSEFESYLEEYLS